MRQYFFFFLQSLGSFLDKYDLLIPTLLTVELLLADQAKAFDVFENMCNFSFKKLNQTLEIFCLQLFKNVYPSYHC